MPILSGHTMTAREAQARELCLAQRVMRFLGASALVWPWEVAITRVKDWVEHGTSLWLVLTRNVRLKSLEGILNAVFTCLHSIHRKQWFTNILPLLHKSSQWCRWKYTTQLRLLCFSRVNYNALTRQLTPQIQRLRWAHGLRVILDSIFNNAEQWPWFNWDYVPISRVWLFVHVLSASGIDTYTLDSMYVESCWKGLYVREIARSNAMRDICCCVCPFPYVQFT